MTDTSIQTVNPLTEQPLETYSVMSDDEAMAVVKNSHTAFLEWRLKSREERAGIIAAIAKELRNSKEEFAQLMTDEDRNADRQALSHYRIAAATTAAQFSDFGF